MIGTLGVTEIYHTQPSAIIMVVKNLLLNAFEAFQTAECQVMRQRRIAVCRELGPVTATNPVLRLTSRMGWDTFVLIDWQMNDPFATFTTKSKIGGLGSSPGLSVLKGIGWVVAFSER